MKKGSGLWHPIQPSKDIPEQSLSIISTLENDGVPLFSFKIVPVVVLRCYDRDVWSLSPTQHWEPSPVLIVSSHLFEFLLSGKMGPMLLYFEPVRSLDSAIDTLSHISKSLCHAGPKLDTACCGGNPVFLPKSCTHCRPVGEAWKNYILPVWDSIECPHRWLVASTI